MELIGEIFEVDYDIEGSDVGYRWFDREQLTPAYPFGWGLSYTTFAFSGLNVTADGTDVTVEGTVTNTGDRAGTHVVQVYASRPAQGGSPSPDNFVPRLAAFVRVDREPGESKPVKLHLEPRLLARWDIEAGAFRIAGGDYKIRIGTHALDEDGPAATTALDPAVLS